MGWIGQAQSLSQRNKLATMLRNEPPFHYLIYILHLCNYNNTSVSLEKKNFFSKEFYSEPLIYCRITCNNRHTFLTRPPVIAAFGNSIATQIVYGFVLSADNRGRINPISSREPCSTVTDE